jgi:large subunit ribosomal protein L4
MAIATYTKTGAKATTPAKLDKAVFGNVPTSHELLKQAYVMYLANGRLNLAVVKNRGDVSGGGKKPWKQKGTGRARFGSTRNPIWRGGGVAFGPTGIENYSKSLNAKAKQTAVRQALSLASDAGKIAVIEDLVASTAKTKDLAALLAKVNATRNVLIVVEHKTPELTRAAQNLQSVKVVSQNYVSVYDVLNADTILFTTAGLKAVTDRLSVKESK